MSGGPAGRTGPASAGSPGAEPSPVPAWSGWARAAGLGVLWASLVVALLLLARAGAGFIYQGF